MKHRHVHRTRPRQPAVSAGKEKPACTFQPGGRQQCELLSFSISINIAPYKSGLLNWWRYYLAVVLLHFGGSRFRSALAAQRSTARPEIHDAQTHSASTRTRTRTCTRTRTRTRTCTRTLTRALTRTLTRTLTRSLTRTLSRRLCRARCCSPCRVP